MSKITVVVKDDGRITSSIQSGVFKGSNKSNELVALLDFPSTSTVKVNFRRADGVKPNSQLLHYTGKTLYDDREYSTFTYTLKEYQLAVTGVLIASLSIKVDGVTTKSGDFTIDVERSEDEQNDVAPADVNQYNEAIDALYSVDAKLVDADTELSGRVTELENRQQAKVLVDFTVNDTTGVGIKYYSDDTTAQVQYPIGETAPAERRDYLTILTFYDISWVVDEDGGYSLAFGAEQTGYSDGKYFANIERAGQTGYKAGTQIVPTERSGHYSSADSVFIGSDGSLYVTSNERYSGRIVLFNGNVKLPEIVSVSAESVGYTESASVENVGTGSDAALEFKIPRGVPPEIRIGHVAKLAPDAEPTVTATPEDNGAAVKLDIAIPQGKGFEIYKTYESLDAMNDDVENIPLNSFVSIDTGSVEDDETAQVYFRTESGLSFINDFSGIQGRRGAGVRAIQADGQDANGGNKYKIIDTDNEPLEGGFTAPRGERGPMGGIQIVAVSHDSAKRIWEYITLSPATILDKDEDNFVGKLALIGDATSAQNIGYLVNITEKIQAAEDNLRGQIIGNVRGTAGKDGTFQLMTDSATYAAVVDRYNITSYSYPAGATINNPDNVGKYCFIAGGDYAGTLVKITAVGMAGDLAQKVCDLKGEDYLICSQTYYLGNPTVGATTNVARTAFNRTPKFGEKFWAVGQTVNAVTGNIQYLTLLEANGVQIITNTETEQCYIREVIQLTSDKPLFFTGNNLGYTTTPSTTSITNFNRTPVIGDNFFALSHGDSYYMTKPTIGLYNVTSVNGTNVSVTRTWVAYAPATKYLHHITLSKDSSVFICFDVLSMYSYSLSSSYLTGFIVSALGTENRIANGFAMSGPNYRNVLAVRKKSTSESKIVVTCYLSGGLITTFEIDYQTELYNGTYIVTDDVELLV